MTDARRFGILAGASAALAACLVGLIVLVTNVPRGFDGLLGFAPSVTDDFRILVSYPRLDLDPAAFRRFGAFVFASPWLLTIVGIACVRHLEGATARRRALVLLGVSAVIHHLLLLFLPPVLSRDLFRYALFGRMVSVHGLNPYATPLDALAGDPLWALAGWRELPTHYGPVFTALSAAAGWLGGGSVLGAALAFKTLGALANLAGMLLVYRLARRETDGGLTALVLYAWNPLFLLESAGNGHNDVVMTTLALAGLWLWAEGRRAAGFAAMTLGALVKFVSGALLPLFLLERLARDRRGAVSEVLRLGAIGLGLCVALYAPFVAPFAGDGFGAGAALVGGRDLGQHGPASTGAWRLPVFALLAAGAVVCAARARTSRAVELASLLALGFVLFVYPWTYPWYFVTPAVLAIAAPPSKTRAALRVLTLGIGAAFMFTYLALDTAP